MKASQTRLSRQPNGLTAFKLNNLTENLPTKDNILNTFRHLTSGLENKFDDHRNDKWGLIFASTKGIIEDFIWQDSVSPQLDPYSPIVDAIKLTLDLSFNNDATVSNACASSHGALELGQRWLKRKEVDHVLVVAADIIGPFIHKGFSSLRALSQHNECKPFDINRDGLLLGDGVGIVVLSNKPIGDHFYLENVYNQCEGFSVTRPDTSGATLSHCIDQSINRTSPDVMIAHGTATYYNDLTEANAIERSFNSTNPPQVTATKWSVGHSLGASGLIDLNAACEIIRHQEVPAIHSLIESDFPISEWLVTENKKMKVDSVLVSSLGFGGICSSFILRKGDSACS